MKNKLAFKTQQGKTAVMKFYDSQLEQWNVPYDTMNVNTRYGNTFIITCGGGSAPPLILLHGSGMNSCMWLEDAREYSRSHRVYIVDIPGEAGRSDENQLQLKGPYYEDWLLDIFDALAIEKAELIGISFGAWLSIKFTICYPGKVSKLVLLSPLGISPQKKCFLFILMSCMILGKRGIDKLYDKINSNLAVPEEMLKYQKLIGDNFNTRNELIPLFSDTELKRLVMPVIMFVGDKDIIIHSEKTAKRLKSLVPHAKINILPGVGHTLVNLGDKLTEVI
jgi:pimeloyl-ACP methyl ester carboxylesterase